MNEETKPNDNPPAETSTPPTPPGKRSFWLPVIVLLVVFLAGFVPMWLKSNRLAGELQQTQLELRRTHIQLALAYSALDARRGAYETARQGAASFFSLVTAELDRGPDSALPANARADLQPLLAQRDDLITLLARGDLASAERMANACERFRKTLAQ